MSYNRVSLIDAAAKCSCRGFNLDKLLQPSILTLLAGGPLHGYLIVQALERRARFDWSSADVTGIYRTLKNLEDRGMVRFEWELGESGPAKKNYWITETGLECLGHWADTLREYRALVEEVQQEAVRALNAKGGGA